LARFSRLIRWATRGALFIVAAVLLIMIVRAFDSRRLPELHPWHRVDLESEFRARDADGVDSLADYLALEARLFEELASGLEAERPLDGVTQYSRYNLRSPSHPARFPRNWNRTQEWRPERIRGGALLLHGLTDSPYSLRTAAELLAEEGYYVLLLRHPGHGTHPGALVDVEYQDWLAAARIGARHVRAEVGDELPLLIAGYSMGGAVAVQLTLEALEDDTLPLPDKMLLVSPAIGVSPAGIVGSWHRLISWSAYFERFRWIDVLPEYDPFKYNSFPKNAGRQMYLLTKQVQAGLVRAMETGTIERFPRTLAFQSAADGTVSTAAVLDPLFRSLGSTEHELVLFDLNRKAIGNGFMDPSQSRSVSDLIASHEVDYRLSLITNESETSARVIEIELGGPAPRSQSRSLGLSWPQSVYSLSHVALPFAADDPLYGVEAPSVAMPNIRIGDWAPRGEKGLLAISMNNVMRLRFNPFLPYQRERIRDWVDIPE
jgi:alpha-beta hydrolase superfamily lysophospholipase